MNLMPGGGRAQVCNDRLLGPDGRPRPGLQKGRDYRGVNREVQTLLLNIIYYYYYILYIVPYFITQKGRDYRGVNREVRTLL